MPMGAAVRLTRGWLEIDLDAIVRNAHAMAARAPAILPMIKADAYGMGAVRVARALERLGPWGYGIATIEEGRELREAGIDRPIVLFTAVDVDELPAVRDARLTPALTSASSIANAMRGACLRVINQRRQWPILRGAHCHEPYIGLGRMKYREPKSASAAGSLRDAWLR